MMWIGFAACMTWCLMRGWQFYNPRVPDLNINVPLEPYFAESVTLPMWRGVRFEVSAIFLSLATFMELGVLFSIVAGYFLFRSQYLVGELSGLSSNAGYPFAAEQQVGGYLMYAILILIPGAQVELLEMGREQRVVPRHLFYAMLAGVVGVVLWRMRCARMCRNG